MATQDRRQLLSAFEAKLKNRGPGQARFGSWASHLGKLGLPGKTKGSSPGIRFLLRGNPNTAPHVGSPQNQASSVLRQQLLAKYNAKQRARNNPS